MGQHLSEPVTTKDTTGSSNPQYRYASSSMQGWRISIFSHVQACIFNKKYMV